MAIYQKPPLEENQAILSTDTQFGLRDYCIVEIKKRSDGKFVAKTSDIDIDDWIDYIKTLEVDKSNNKITAYCRKGKSLKKMWDSIPKSEKQIIV